MHLFTNTNFTGNPVYKRITQHLKWMVILFLGMNFLMSDLVAQSPPCTFTVIDSHTNALCKDSANGTITINVSGGTAPYQISLNNGAFTTLTSPVITGLAAGSYNYVIRDANNCTASGSEIVQQPLSLQGTFTFNNPNCEEQGGPLVASGGTPPYIIVNVAEGAPLPIINGNQVIIRTAGIYSITDFNGCSVVIPVRFPDGGPTPEVTSTHTDVSCDGTVSGTITLSFAGGPQLVTFNGGDFETRSSPVVFPGLSAGTYQYSVGNVCTQTIGFETVEVAGPFTASASHTDAICNGQSTPTNGSVTLTFGNIGTVKEVSFNGNPFETKTSPVTYDGLAPGNYSYEIRDTYQCFSTTGFEAVGQPVLDALPTNVLCFGGSSGSVLIDLSDLRVYPYTINFPGFFPYTSSLREVRYPNLRAGTYNYTVVDADGCQMSGSETVDEPAELAVIDGHSDVLCNEALTGSITIQVSGGTGPYQVQFPGRELSIIASPTAMLTYSGLAAGTYHYTVVDANGCQVSGSETIATRPCIYDGCGPGFWKNHQELWDNVNDPIVGNIADLGGPVFTTNTPVATLFGFLPAGYPAGITMHGMISQGGGQCKAFGRHAVAALLSSASGLNIDYPNGASNYTTLFHLIRQALLTGNCSGSLAAQLAQISEADHENCGEVIPVFNSRNRISQVIIPKQLEGLTVNTYPNPYKDVISFKIESSVSGRAVLDVYNLKGQKLKTVYEGNLVAGKPKTIQFVVPPQNRETMMYRLSTVEKTTTGKLLYID